jgi:hypothetical protein
MKIEKNLKMKAGSKSTPMTFGDFVAGVYETWGKRRAKGIVHLAVEAHLIKFCSGDRVKIF